MLIRLYLTLGSVFLQFTNCGALVSDNAIFSVCECNQTCAGIGTPGMAYEPSDVFIRQH